MPIREFELFHGAVLTKLVRAERPLTLTMTETRPGDAWSSYRINDAVSLLLKHSLASKVLHRGEGGRTWQFVFSRNQVVQLSTEGAWAALICGSNAVSNAETEVCLLSPEQIRELIDVNATGTQSVSVKYIKGKMLRVSSGSAAGDVLVARGRLEKWEVPGS